MSEYVPQVGDRVTNQRVTATVIGVHGKAIWVVTDGNEDDPWTTDAMHWTKVPTFPECWINVYDDALSEAHASRREADDECLRPWRIGVIHLRADGTLTMEGV